MDTEEIEFSRRIDRERTVYNIMMLVPHTRYLVSIKVQSADMTSEVVEGNTITMIDRKSFYMFSCMAIANNMQMWVNVGKLPVYDARFELNYM